jgi:hypothetical protein
MNKIVKKILIRISVVAGGLFLLYKLVAMYSPSSHVHAERYELNYAEEKVIEAINNLKKSDNDLIIPAAALRDSARWNLNDGKEKTFDHYQCYFYDKANDRILFTWIKSSTPNQTTFAFVSVNEGLDAKNWKDVNDDFTFFENRKIVNSFEETILAKVKSKLTNN